MATFEQIKSKVMDFASVAKEKSEDLADQAKIHASILDTKRRLNSLYIEIGRLVVSEEQTHDEAFDITLQSNIQKARCLESELKDKKEELKTGSNATVCPVCTKTTSSEHTFCPYCGATLSSEEYN